MTTYTIKGYPQGSTERLIAYQGIEDMDEALEEAERIGAMWEEVVLLGVTTDTEGHITDVSEMEI